MKEHPILFSCEMVKAILDGQKTMTRRVVKPQPPTRVTDIISLCGEWLSAYPNRKAIKPFEYKTVCPYGVHGDRLWVRETWNVFTVGWDDYNGGWEIGYQYEEIPKKLPEHCNIVYAASHADDGPFRPSIHMPRWASRITLEIASIRVERLQDISEEDAQEEGIITDPKLWDACYIDGFIRLWDSINAARGFSWERNPWVWVIEFKKLKPNKGIFT